MRRVLVLSFLMAMGCSGAGPNMPALDALNTLTKQVQPIVDRTLLVCDEAHNALEKAGKPTENIDAQCGYIVGLFKTLQLAQEAAVIAYGGEPCSSGCE